MELAKSVAESFVKAALEDGPVVYRRDRLGRYGENGDQGKKHTAASSPKKERSQETMRRHLLNS